MPIDHTRSNESAYFIDPEDAAEMARLMHQDRLFTEGMGGLFPERSGDLSHIKDILDIACGPGAWVIDVARSYPDVRVTGIDISKLMIEYARAQARVQWLDNAHFEVMDAVKPLVFSDNSFDLVNARSIFGFMPTTAWPRLMQECMRIMRPGGVIRLTEFDTYGISNSPACEKINELGLLAFKRAGQSFSPDARSLGITPMLSRFLREAGCVDIHHMAHAIDYSTGTEAHGAMYTNSKVVFKLSQPFMRKMDVAKQELLDALYDQALREMASEDFCGIWFYLTVYGTKPV